MEKSIATSLIKRKNVRMQSFEPVFAFEDPIDYLNFELRNRQKKNPKYSLRAWARELGYENPSYLSQVLKRERKLKPDLAVKIADSLDLEGKPQKYFEVMVMGAGTVSNKEKKSYQQLIRTFRPKRETKFNSMSLDMLSIISDWYHYAITEMPQLKNFESSDEYIYRKLGKLVDRRTVREAVERLLQKGFLIRLGNGAIGRGSVGNYSIEPSMASQAMRNIHRQLIDLARRALDEQSVDERDFFFTTLSFKKENLGQVREILREAHKKVIALESTEGGDEVYNLNTHFFKLTKSMKRKKAL